MEASAAVMRWRVARGASVLVAPCLDGRALLGQGDVRVEGEALVRVGVDPVQMNVQRARVEAARLGIRAAFVPGQAWSLPFADGSFDAVWSCGGLETAPDPLDVLVELTRVLRRGGALRVAAMDGPFGAALRAVRTPDTQAPVVIQSMRAWERSNIEAWCDAVGLSCAEIAPRCWEIQR